MDSSTNPALALLGFWMLLQLVAFLALLWGGIYFLFCLNRASSSLDRLATAAERWVEDQEKPLPGQSFSAGRITAPPSVTPVAPSPPVPVPPPLWRSADGETQSGTDFPRSDGGRTDGGS